MQYNTDGVNATGKKRTILEIVFETKLMTRILNTYTQR